MDTSPAVFIRKETAALVADNYVRRVIGAVGYAVVPHKRRGEMQGYSVHMRFVRGRAMRLTEADIEELQGA